MVLVDRSLRFVVVRVHFLRRVSGPLPLGSSVLLLDLKFMVLNRLDIGLPPSLVRQLRSLLLDGGWVL